MKLRYLLITLSLLAPLNIFCGKKIKLMVALGRVHTLFGKNELSNRIIEKITKRSSHNEIDEDLVNNMITQALNNASSKNSNNNSVQQDDADLALAIQESLKITSPSKQEMSDAEYAQSLEKKEQRTRMDYDEQLARRLQEQFDTEIAHKTSSSSDNKPNNSHATIKNGIITRPVSNNNNFESQPSYTFNPAAIKLIANKQVEGNSCGYHAFANAKAIQDLVDRKEAVTQESIQQQAIKYLHVIKSHEAETPELEVLGHRHHIPHLYFLHLNEQGKVKPAYQGHVSCKEKEAEIAGFRTRKDAIVHCICNTGGHWILVSLIKKAGNPRLIFLDSANGNLEAGSANYKFAEYLYNLVIK